jgi:hypothetical protein
MRRSDGWQLRSNYLDYDVASGVYATADRPFRLTYRHSEVRGVALRYESMVGRIAAKKIDATIDGRDRD